MITVLIDTVIIYTVDNSNNDTRNDKHSKRNEKRKVAVFQGLGLQGLG